MPEARTQNLPIGSEIMYQLKASDAIPYETVMQKLLTQSDSRGFEAIHSLRQLNLVKVTGRSGREWLDLTREGRSMTLSLNKEVPLEEYWYNPTFKERFMARVKNTVVGFLDRDTISLMRLCVED